MFASFILKEFVACRASGAKIAKVSLHSWGNPKLTTLSSNNFSGYNPIRYRGYYYDAESGFYFLNARYYNPAWRRFTSPDDTAYLDPDTPNGLNLYVCCNNDPVNYSDPSGHAPKWWESILIGIGIIAVASLISAAILCSAGCSIPFWSAVGQAALGGLKIAATAGATAGIIRAGKTAIEGGNIQDVGKSLVLGFSDGFFAGSIYAEIGMISAGLAYKVIGAIDYGYGFGYGWKEFSSSGTLLRQGMYLTPNVGGVVFIANHFGVNGGRSFALDLDINNGLHYHSNKFSFGPKK